MATTSPGRTSSASQRFTVRSYAAFALTVGQEAIRRMVGRPGARATLLCWKPAGVRLRRQAMRHGGGASRGAFLPEAEDGAQHEALQRPEGLAAGPALGLAAG